MRKNTRKIKTSKNPPEPEKIALFQLGVQAEGLFACVLDEAY